MITNVTQQHLEDTQRLVHADCIVCGGRSGCLPRIRFYAAADGTVEATFQPRVTDEGYEGILHGGIIATLLDAAMTNCLFAQGRCGVTADLHVRYQLPVSSSESCVLRARLERSTLWLHVLRAELWQSDQLRARATGKFLESFRIATPDLTHGATGSKPARHVSPE